MSRITPQLFINNMNYFVKYVIYSIYSFILAELCCKYINILCLLF